jgi:hypothetical protein
MLDQLLPPSGQYKYKYNGWRGGGVGYIMYFPSKNHSFLVMWDRGQCTVHTHNKKIVININASFQLRMLEEMLDIQKNTHNK